jgi:N-acyl amino acid synthase of PEP-CTERM/exosortase system
VRLVLPSTNGFPLFEHCELFPEFSHLADKAAQQTTAEISRLAISKLYRRRQNDGFYGFDAKTDFDNAELNENCAPAMIADQTPHRRTKPEIVLGLYKTMYQASKRQGITHWFAAMEKSLLRLLHRYNIGFTPIGPELDYYGPVVPYIAAISAIEEAVARNCPEMFAQFIEGLEPHLVPEYARAVA